MKSTENSGKWKRHEKALEEKGRISSSKVTSKRIRLNGKE